MYQALWSFITCVVVTVLVSLATKPMPDSRLSWTRVWVDGSSFGWESSVVPEASFLGWPGDSRGIVRAQHYFLVARVWMGDFLAPVMDGTEQ
jgi:hypothetical protein